MKDERERELLLWELTPIDEVLYLQDMLPRDLLNIPSSFSFSVCFYLLLFVSFFFLRSD